MLNSAETVDLFATFGGVRSSSNSKNFRGEDIAAVFGGLGLDLRDSSIEKTPAKINIVSLFEVLT